MRKNILCVLTLWLTAALALAGCNGLGNLPGSSNQPPAAVADGPVAAALTELGYKAGTALPYPGFAGFTRKPCGTDFECDGSASYAYVTLDGQELEAVEGSDDLRCTVRGDYRNFAGLTREKKVEVLRVPYMRSSKATSIGDAWNCSEAIGPEK